MRKRLFNLHLLLGRAVGVLMIVWALSGALMTCEPLLVRGLDPAFPRLGPRPVDPVRFERPVSEVVPPGEPVAAVELHESSQRVWYEVRTLDGRVEGYDARTGARTSPYFTRAELREKLSAQLAGTRWSLAAPPVMLESYDDHYRKDELPAFRAELTGPAGVVIYCSARTGEVLKVTTRVSRAIRWLGMGVHTWNLQALRAGYDEERRVALALLVALPVASMAILGFVLLAQRSSGVWMERGLSRAVGRAVAGSVRGGGRGSGQAGARGRAARGAVGGSAAPGDQGGERVRGGARTARSPGRLPPATGRKNKPSA